MRVPHVIGIGVGEFAVFLHGGVELIVVEQGLRQRAHGPHIAGFNVDGSLDRRRSHLWGRFIWS